VKLVIGIISASIILVVGIFIAAFWWNSQLQPVAVGDTASINLVIPQNQSALVTVNELFSHHLIRSPLVARLYLKVTGQDQKIRPGAYQVSPGQSLPEIFSALVSGPKDIWVTLPEGWRREQMAVRLQAALEKSSYFDPQTFISQTATLEGQLFPDTYLVPSYADTADVISLLTANFSAKTDLDPVASYVINMGKTTSRLTGRDIIVLASLVEREVRRPEDRPIVAGILLKRLDAGWPLQIDATVQYASDTAQCSRDLLNCQWWKPVMDTRILSAYNTYLHTGLPPAPIANPGLASLKAIQAPQDTPYWYYLTDNNGINHYSRTLGEHNANVNRYLH
jgi:UPF0755 protein